jgi:hypothetical protein
VTFSFLHGAFGNLTENRSIYCDESYFQLSFYAQIIFVLEGVVKGSERQQGKEKICEIAEFTEVNEQIFDAVLLSAVVLRHPL